MPMPVPASKAELETLLYTFIAESNKQKAIDVFSKYLLCVHDPTLHKPDEGPMENEIFIFLNDGEITREKGGWAFGQRNVFTYRYPVYPVYEKPIVTNLPLGRGNNTGIMVTRDDALKCRDFMEAISKIRNPVD